MIKPLSPKDDGRGRLPIGLARMLRMYVAQQCFFLSDECTEDALYIGWPSDASCALLELRVSFRCDDPPKDLPPAAALRFAAKDLGDDQRLPCSQRLMPVLKTCMNDLSLVFGHIALAIDAIENANH